MVVLIVEDAIFPNVFPTDKDFDIVMDVVSRWCALRRIEIDSNDGRRALTAAVDLICNHRQPDELTKAISDRLH